MEINLARYAINTFKLIVAFACFIIGQIFVTASINSIFDIVPRITRIFPATEAETAKNAAVELKRGGGDDDDDYAGKRGKEDVTKSPMSRSETVAALTVNSGAVSAVAGARR